MIPVDRSGANVSKALREARRRIEKGELIGIFPEGTRSRDGLLHMGHGGVAHLSLKTGTPIIPVGISGTDGALPVGSRAPRRVPITITLGSLIGPGGRGGRTASMRQRQALTTEVMESIAALSGQEQACKESSATATSSKPVGA